MNSFKPAKKPFSTLLLQPEPVQYEQAPAQGMTMNLKMEMVSSSMGGGSGRPPSARMAEDQAFAACALERGRGRCRDTFAALGVVAPLQSREQACQQCLFDSGVSPASIFASNNSIASTALNLAWTTVNMAWTSIIMIWTPLMVVPRNFSFVFFSIFFITFIQTGMTAYREKKRYFAQVFSLSLSQRFLVNFIVSYPYF